MAEQVAESSLFSLFSEYEPHLLEQYDLFYLDTSFRSGTENMDEICAHLWKFTELNTADAEGRTQEGLALQGVSVKDPVRLTDGQGAVFYRQAVQAIKEETGLSLAEDWIFDEAFQQKLEDDSRSFQEDCEMYEGSVVDCEYEEGEEEMSSEAENWDGYVESVHAAAGDGSAGSNLAEGNITGAGTIAQDTFPRNRGRTWYRRYGT